MNELFLLQLDLLLLYECPCDSMDNSCLIIANFRCIFYKIIDYNNHIPLPPY